MNDINILIHIFAAIDDLIKSIEIVKKPGVKGRLSDSKILTLMLLHPILKPFSKLMKVTVEKIYINDNSI